MNDNYKNISCEHADGIVSYLYGEMPASDRNVFETHLAQCGSCTDEFAGISLARYSVYEWNKLEFAEMATPRIVIPYDIDVAFSWFDKLRAALSFGHGLPTAGAAIAAVAIAFGLVMFGSNFYRGERNMLAETNLNNTQTNTRVAISDTPEKPPLGPPASVPVKSMDRNPSAKQAVPVKISDGLHISRPVNFDSAKDKKIAPQKQTRAVPRLNEFAEDEDKTLRLADVFDDIETSE